MNIEHFKELRKLIEALPEKACNMRTWLDTPTDDPLSLSAMRSNAFQCGTAGCLAGWASVLHRGEAIDEAYAPPEDDAIQYLDLDDDEASYLFTTWPRNSGRGFAWKPWMLQRLDKIIETGVIESADDSEED